MSQFFKYIRSQDNMGNYQYLVIVGDLGGKYGLGFSYNTNIYTSAV